MWFLSYPFHSLFQSFFSPPSSLSHISADIWNVWIGQSSLRGLASVWMMLCVCFHVRVQLIHSSTHSKSFLSSLHLKWRVTLLDLCINRNSFPAGEPCYGKRESVCDIYGVSSCPAFCSHLFVGWRHISSILHSRFMCGVCVLRGEILYIIQLEQGGSSIITKYCDLGCKKKRSTDSGGVHWVLIISFCF